MNISFNGFNENVLTFIADSTVEEGMPVKISADGTVSKCANNDAFCGLCVGVREGYATVQLTGYAVFPAGAKVTVGYTKLAVNSEGKVAANNSGREYLVVDSTATEIGIIL